jgi:hypothetical protein
MGYKEVTTDQKKVILWTLQSEINAFQRELNRRGPRQDYYGEPQWDAALAHCRLLESAYVEVGRIKVK